MYLRKVWVVLIFASLFGYISGDGGYASSAGTGENYRSPGKACWWTQRDDVEYPVRIEVMDSSVGLSDYRGSFGVGGISPDYVPLTRNFHWPDSIDGQHFVLSIDGTYYSFANYTGSQLVVCGTPVTLRQIDDYFQGSDTSTVEGQVQIRSHWRIPVMDDSVDLFQLITPVKIGIESDTFGMAKIHYIVVNNHYESHAVGIKLLVDAVIGTGPLRDRPEIHTDETVSSLSQTYCFPSIPTYWWGADNDSFSTSTVFARGILKQLDATTPDYFIIGDQAGLWRHIWVCTGCSDSEWWIETFPGYATGDVAFLLQWDPQSVSAEDTIDWITYYGFYNTTSSVKESNLPTEYSIDAFPNPFNSSCAITAPAGAKIELYDLRGNVIATSFDADAPLSPLIRGTNERAKRASRGFVWCPDESIPSGIYLMKATTKDGLTITKRIVYLK
ncbi:hypothetical protein DRQ33_02860 [bacterium]|nr:MAG: hypothetical protein DRQ33_02860 [bacterium]